MTKLDTSLILKFSLLREAQREIGILPRSYCKTQTQLFGLFILSFFQYIIWHFLLVWSLGNVGAVSDKATIFMQKNLVYSLLDMPGPHRLEWAPVSVVLFTRYFTQLLTSGLLVIINSILIYQQLRNFLPQFSGKNERSYRSGSSGALWGKMTPRTSTKDEKCKLHSESFTFFGRPSGRMHTRWTQ